MFLVSLLLALTSSTSSTPASSVECGACMLIISQFEIRIAKIDPKKTIESGSYRVGPNGEQLGLHQIPYARSETHLTEILENVCDEAKNYKLVTNTLTGKAVYVHNDSTYLKGEESSKMRSKLQAACNDFVDAHEEVLFAFLKKGHEEPARGFCQLEMGICSSVDVSALPPNEPAAVEPEYLSDIPADEL